MGTSPPPPPPPADLNTGLAAVIYGTLLRRLGDYCENYGVIIARERPRRFVIATKVDRRISARL